MEEVETYTRKKWGCTYLVYSFHAGILSGSSLYAKAHSLAEARQLKTRHVAANPTADLRIWHGDREHPQAREVW